jgi:alpha-galactosidase
MFMYLTGTKTIFRTHDALLPMPAFFPRVRAHFLPVLLAAGLLAPACCRSQTPDLSLTFGAPQPVTIALETQDHALVLQTDTSKRLVTTYFGPRLLNPAEYALAARQNRFNDGNAGLFNHAYTPSGTWNLVEPALAVVQADGNPSIELQYVSHRVQSIDANVQLTTVELRDPVYAVDVRLQYKTYHRENTFEQWTTIENRAAGPLTLYKYASANLYLTGKQFYLRHYHGGWGREMQPEETLLSHGMHVLDSKLGARANLFQPPSFVLALNRPASEDDGTVLLGTLAWSGNFRIDFEVDLYDNLRLLAGINPHASAYPLAAGEAFTTPSFIYTVSVHGTGEASRNMHRWARKYRLLDGEGSRQTLLNNWEATYFNFDENRIAELIHDGKKLGVDVFLLDDGWFGNKYPRNDDRAGLGDWQENRAKLPNGIGYLVREATKAGIRFGIWVEPEMVNPQSELYEQHRDWVLRQPRRPEHYFRNQLVLDLSNPAVQDFVFGILDTLLTENPELGFIKWDCNAVIFDAYSAHLQQSGAAQTKVYVDYVKGLYRVLDRVRAKYPRVPMMLCSGGGGRVDYEALRYFTEFWLSDNTHPLERVFIQWEYSYFFPAIAHCNHVTDWSKLPLKYRTDVAMMGKLGYDIVVGELNDNDLQFSQQAVATYKSISDVVWHGDLYRLSNPWENDFASVAMVDESRTRAVMFNYMTSNRFAPNSILRPVRLRGLDPARQYRVREINLYPGKKSTLDGEATYSGDYLMNVGFNPDISSRRMSVVLEITALR